MQQLVAVVRIILTLTEAVSSTRGRASATKRMKFVEGRVKKQAATVDSTAEEAPKYPLERPAVCSRHTIIMIHHANKASIKI